MEEESLKERSAVVRVQVPLAIGAFLLNEKRGDLADIESRTGTHIVIIPNMNLETPHYLVERLRADQAKVEGEIPSHMLSDLANQSQQQEIPTENQAPAKREAAVKPQFSQVPPAPVIQEHPKQEAKQSKPGFFSRLMKGLFSDAPVVEEKDPVEKSSNNRSRSRKEEEPGNRRRSKNGNESRRGRNDRPERERERNGDDEGKNNERPRRNKPHADGENHKTEAPSADQENNDRRKPRREDRRRGKEAAPQKLSDSTAAETEAFEAVAPEQRQPSAQTLANSKRQPKRDRNSHREPQPGKAKQATSSATVVVQENPEPTKPRVPEETPKPRVGRANNDPRNRNKAATAASMSDIDQAADEEPQTISENTTEIAAAEHAKVKAPQETLETNAEAIPAQPGTTEALDADNRAAAEQGPESAKLEEPSTASENSGEKEPSAPKEPSARKEPSAPKEPSAQKEPRTRKEPATTPIEDVIDASENDAEISSDAAKTPTEPAPARPARAANDPREVRRREREDALRAQGVTINNPSRSRQDTTEGSNSSST
jgi:ribonuclease E